VDHGKTTLTAALTKVMARLRGQFMAYDQIDKAPEEKARGLRFRRRTWSTRARSGTTRTWTARHADYVKNMITVRADGRSDSGGVGGGRPMRRRASTFCWRQ